MCKGRQVFWSKDLCLRLLQILKLQSDQWIYQGIKMPMQLKHHIIWFIWQYGSQTVNVSVFHSKWMKYHWTTSFCKDLSSLAIVNYFQIFTNLNQILTDLKHWPSWAKYWPIGNIDQYKPNIDQFEQIFTNLKYWPNWSKYWPIGTPWPRPLSIDSAALSVHNELIFPLQKGNSRFGLTLVSSVWSKLFLAKYILTLLLIL